VFTVLGVSGSSIGYFDRLLGEPTSGLLAGAPQGIRSDEWAIISPLTLGQSITGFGTINPNIGNGQDMAMIGGVPCAEWGALLTPQNLAYFVLPFVNAFAFAWWSISAILLVGVYFGVLALFPNRRLVAILVAVCTLFSPFIQWWYLSGTAFPIAFGAILLALVIAFLRGQDEWGWGKRLAWIGGVTYFSASFAVLMYPPFQVPVMIVVCALLIAHYFGRYRASYIFKKRRWLWLLTPIVLAMAVFGGYVYEHRQAVAAMLDTVWPGARVIPTGSARVTDFLSWPLAYWAADQRVLPLFHTNSSEFSQFIYVGLLLVPFLFYVCLRRYRHSKTPEDRYVLFIATGLVLCSALFAWRMFIPFGGSLLQFIGLGSIPMNRLRIGLGVINLFAVSLALSLPSYRRSVREAMLDSWTWLAAMIVGVCMGMSLEIVRLSAGLVGIIGKGAVIGLSVAIAMMVGLLLNRSMWVRMIGAGALVVFSMSTCLSVNPLQQGVAPLTDNAAVLAMQAVDPSRTGRWVFTNSGGIDTLAVANGYWSLSNTYSYPQMEFWQEYFPGANPLIYNRYAHVVVNVDDSYSYPDVILLANNAIQINIGSCDPVFSQLKIQYMMAPVGQKYGCFSQIRSVNDSLAVYQRSSNG